MDLFDQIADVQTLREDFDDHLIGDRVIIDMDGAGMQSMSEYWERFPNASVHADTFCLEWGSSVGVDRLVMVNHEAGKWQIGVYPIAELDGVRVPSISSVWFAEVVDETSAVLTLHVLLEVL